MPDSAARAGPPSRSPGVDPAQAQHPGRRDSQQDACGFSNLADAAFAEHGGHLAVLADGMGGMRNGLWAATHAVQAFIAAYHAKTPEEPIPSALQRALAAANDVVHGEAVRLDAVDRMGTTLAAAVVRGLELHWLNVGDSRVYVAEDKALMCLSTDHNYAAVLRQRVHRGELSAGEALAHPLRDALTSYLGRPSPLQHAASRAPVQLRPGARVLLCSDGLTEALDDDAIRAELRGNAQDACDRLLRAALARARPDQDNVTAVLLHVPRPGRPPEAGSVSRAMYLEGDLAARLPLAAAAPVAASAPTSAAERGGARASAAAAAPPANATPAPRARWREPLWWTGAVAAAGALALLWLFLRTPAPAGPEPAPVVRPGPSIDLLAPPPASSPR